MHSLPQLAAAWGPTLCPSPPSAAAPRSADSSGGRTAGRGRPSPGAVGFFNVWWHGCDGGEPWLVLPCRPALPACPCLHPPQPLSQAANPGSYGAAKPRGGGLRPRDANMPVVSQQAPAAEKKPAPAAGRSMSQLLHARSEAAMSGGKAAARHRAAPAALPDIDSVHAADPLHATEFVADIFSYYKRVEPQLRVAPDYMTRQVGCGDCVAWGKLRGSGAAALACQAAAGTATQPLCRAGPAVACHAYPLSCLTASPAPASCPCAAPQTDINDKMRAILVDWLVDVHLKFKVGMPRGHPAIVLLLAAGLASCVCPRGLGPALRLASLLLAALTLALPLSAPLLRPRS